MEYVITRDKDGELKLHLKTDKYPFLVDEDGDNSMWCGRHIQLDGDLFPDIVYGMKPIAVEIEVKLKENNEFEGLSNNEISQEQSQEIS